MTHKAELVRCVEHGEAACWKQSNGEHISRHECTCKAKPPYLCPIDGHSIKYLLENPEWEEEGPKRHAIKDTPPPQECEHRGPKTLVDLPYGIRSWLCGKCAVEIQERTGEEQRPPTAIELYANRKEDEMSTGCTYNVGSKKVVKTCKIATADGGKFCPRHVLIAAADEKKAADRELAKRARAAEKTTEGRAASRPGMQRSA